MTCCPKMRVEGRPGTPFRETKMKGCECGGAPVGAFRQRGLQCAPTSRNLRTPTPTRAAERMRGGFAGEALRATCRNSQAERAQRNR